ncbi:nicotinate-nucleotide--dimethylbenzimidazole phosphoribosyltransferase [Streptomyces clavuligerus]|nr:nicotinate-nucleotide--dimethylbenzimidazole phosphoribosyltransferase [Streptomyces clavuligerus]
MTDTGQVPGEGQPENAGVVGQQPGVPGGDAYTFLEPSGHLPDEDDLLLMPGAQGAWIDPQAVQSLQHGPQSGQVRLPVDRTGQVPVGAHPQIPEQYVPVPAAQPMPGQQQVPVAPDLVPAPELAAPTDLGAPDAAVPPQPVIPAQATAPPQPAGAPAAPAAPPVGTTAPVPPAARRPLHMGPPLPDTTGGVVRSLADRGPAGVAPHPLTVQNTAVAAPPAVEHVEHVDHAGSIEPIEYAGVPQGEPVVLPGPQLGEIPPQPGAPWGPQAPQQAVPVPEPAPEPVPPVPAEAVAAEPVPSAPAAPVAPVAPVEEPADPAGVPAVEEAAPEAVAPEAVMAEPAATGTAAPEAVLVEAQPVAPEESAPEAAAEQQPVPAEQPEPAQPVAQPERTGPVVPEEAPEAVAPEAVAPEEAAPEAAPGPAPEAVSEVPDPPVTVEAVEAEPEPVPVPVAAPEPVFEQAPEPEPQAEAVVVVVAAELPEAAEAAEPGEPVEGPEAAVEVAEPALVPVAEPEAEPVPVVAVEQPVAVEAAPAAVVAEADVSVPQPPAEPAEQPVPEAEAEVVAEVVSEPESVVPEQAPEQAPAPEPEPGAMPEPGPVSEPEEIPAPARSAPAPGYDDAEREAVLRVMRERRDIRNGFRGDPIPHEVLLRVLEAAHTAPSVGHSQPWDFVVIRSAETRSTMHELAQRQRDAYAKTLPKGRAKQFKELKIEAILETPVNIVVTADPTRGGRHTLGRHTQPQMAPYSSALAVENLWLAARAEGLGVGWVSFFDEREMVRALGLPEHLEVVAYLCVGYVDEFPEEPELTQAGWSKRRPLSWVVHEETYGRRALPGEEPHDLLQETVANIRPLDAKALGEAWERQKRMTKPAGALGMLEIISAQLSGLSRVCPPPIPEPAAVAVFAGDHGVHAQGVTAWPQEVTGQMVANFLGGGAVCNAFAHQVGAEVCVIDVGVASELPATPGLLPRKVRPGTADFTTGPAMTREETLAAIDVGIETARDLVAAGNRALLTGEMGIANTTVSSALISVFTGVDPGEITGGTGINDEMHARKVDVVRRALELHAPDPADPVGVLAAVGGLEHAAMVGLILGGASLRTPVVLDGVSAGAAALAARAIAPESLAACIAGHRSAEPGHVAALNKLGLRPLVDLDLRLGEGTGALLALPLVQSAARAMHEVATFDSAGVTEK